MCATVGDGALSVVRDGLKSTLRLSVIALDLMLEQVHYSITLFLSSSIHLLLVKYFHEQTANSRPVYMHNVQCSGTEHLTLLDCSYGRNLSYNNHSKDIGLQCIKSISSLPHIFTLCTHVLLYMALQPALMEI